MPITAPNPRFVTTARHRVLEWPDLAEGRLTPRSPVPQRRPVNFLPLGYAHSSRGKKAARPPSCAVLRA